MSDFTDVISQTHRPWFSFRLFAACLVCVRCKFGISRVLSFCFHPGDPPPPTPPPPPLAREILEQGSDWKHVSRKRQPERRASVLLGREARRAPRWKPQKKKKYKKQKTKNSALLSILDYSCPGGKFFALRFFQPYRCTRNIRVRALMHVVFACTVIAQKCKDPSLSMPIRTRVSVNPPCKK